MSNQPIDVTYGPYEMFIQGDAIALALDTYGTTANRGLEATPTAVATVSFTDPAGVDKSSMMSGTPSLDGTKVVTPRFAPTVAGIYVYLFSMTVEGNTLIGRVIIDAMSALTA
jgi:hypothetical protein